MDKRPVKVAIKNRASALMALAPMIALFALLAALAMSLAARQALGGVVLAPPLPPPEAPKPDENYAESSFGKPPARPSGRASIAARAADEMDREAGFGATADSDLTDPSGQSGAGNRRPAGFQFSDGSSVGSIGQQSSGLSGGAASDRGSRGLEPLTVVRRGVQEVSLIAGDLGFFPRTIFATRDVPVRLFVTGASKNTLCLMMDSFQVRRQVRQARIEEITFTPGSSGKYRFYCPVNGMEGTLVVRELGSHERVDDSVATSRAAPVRETASERTSSNVAPSNTAPERARRVSRAEYRTTRDAEAAHDVFHRPGGSAAADESSED